MKSTNKLSKKQLKQLIIAKISIGISEIAKDGEKAENVQKTIKKASKLISSELRKNLKAHPRAEIIAPSLPELAVSEEISVAKKAIKKSKILKNAPKSAKVAKKAVKKVKVAKKAIKKASSASKTNDAESSGSPMT